MIKLVKKYKWQILIQITFIFLNIYFLTYPPKIIGKMVDLLYDIQANKQAILFHILYLLGSSIVILMMRMIWKYFETYIARAIEKDLKNKLYEKIMKIRLAKLQEIKNGELMSYFVKDINDIRGFVYRLLSFGTRLVATLLIAFITMSASVNLNLTLATISPIIVTAYLIVKIKTYVELSYRKAQASFTDLSEYVQESTDSIRTTKAYCCETEQLKTFIRKNRKLRSDNNNVDIHQALLKSCINIGFGICYSISLLYGANLVLNHTITIGEFVAFNGYIGLFVGPVSWLPSIIAYLKRAQVAYQRLDKVFSLETEKISAKKIKENKENKTPFIGDIEVKDLSFHYPNSLTPTLSHISFTVDIGQTLGIIGTIGSGKTTLMNLLLKLYEVQRGQIFIDGKDILDIPIEVLRNNICYITQDNFLFSATLRENISLFREEDYADNEIEKSTKDALIYDDICQMPNDIHTVIGERGVDLSGGQKQRIVISRAFLQKSNVVIFDDTFSALDNRTEQSLLHNIKELTKDKTCIIVSNRISDIKESDEILVLDGGDIVQRGTHEQLIEQQGLYNQFYKQQASQTEDSFLH